jgi:hypothetical protein
VTVGVIAAAVLSGAVAVQAQRGRTAAAMADAAKAFLASLTPEQRTKATYAFDHDERKNWGFVPSEILPAKKRFGVPLKEMNADQRKAALALLQASMSEKGKVKADKIRALENVLLSIEKGSGPLRDPENYFFTVFGDPGGAGNWGWRYEGHHCAQNWAVIRQPNGDRIIVASTPQFFGTNPAEVREGPLKGTRVLAAEEDLARDLVKSLTDAQKPEGITAATAPPDIITGARRQAEIQEDKGIAYSKLSAEQQAKLKAVVQEYADAMPAGVAMGRIRRIERAGWDNVKFAWMGGVDKGQPHYYRIQGTTFLIEYDNTQNNANHVHCVWRDFKGDFGMDLLAMHYRVDPHRKLVASR